ncbi:MAG: hypothetical protein Q4G59_05630 [Planctomycetia bacterium]|nr:hypothetical protein [Planctomycetia bacterium]
MKNNELNRRTFLAATALAASSSLISDSSLLATTGKGRIPYENTLRDHLWMWGHNSGQYDGPNNGSHIPLSDPISMPDAIKYMGIPNVCVIWGAQPDKKYRDQFKDVKRIAWDLSAGSNRSYHYLKDYVFSIMEEMPNLVGVYLDDFFSRKPATMQKVDGKEIMASSAALSPQEMADLRRRLDALKRPVDLAIVLYADQFGQLNSGIQPACEYADVISYWTWFGDNIAKMGENFKRYRELVPKKRTLHGIYMWDFGRGRPVELSAMKHQLDFSLEAYSKGDIDGLIFHCTPLCNKKLEAVEYARQWIAEYGDTKR